jgi:hypothetical protein
MTCGSLVARGGVEPPTFRFSVGVSVLREANSADSAAKMSLAIKKVAVQ